MPVEPDLALGFADELKPLVGLAHLAFEQTGLRMFAQERTMAADP
jgi:hypothetical protein